MQKLGKILVVTQHYPPDPSTTATYIGAIAEGLAGIARVVVLSGSPNSIAHARAAGSRAEIIEIPNLRVQKHDLVRRAIAISLLALRLFFSTLTRASRDDVVFCVTTPFTLPYAVVLAAKLKGAATALLIYDLYPEALEASGLVKPGSFTVRLFRLANRALFRALDAIITVGRDVQPLLLAYAGVRPEKIHFIPNWTLLPVGYREAAPDNRFRAGRGSQLIVGLSGNLGFTHSPRTIFEAARLLRDDHDIHLLLSGWGIGFRELGELQAAEKLSNVTLLDPVPQEQLVEFLSSADVWVIPYRRNIAGVSIPSRMYNLMAVGRAFIVAAEPHAEAALVVNEESIGWAVPPEDASALADAVRRAAADRAATRQMGRRAAVAAEKYSPDIALARYREVVPGAGNACPSPPDEPRRGIVR